MAGVSTEVEEFVYRLPANPGGHRPGAHASRSIGAGLAFGAHLRLFDYPDPRRLDLSASLRDPSGQWLVRANRQRSSLTVQLIVDVSASMHFGSERRKLDVVADFAESLGNSAFRTGDGVSLMAFDEQFREDAFRPGRTGRGVGPALAEVLRLCKPGYGGAATGQPGIAESLSRCVAEHAGREGLVFLVSDFHWSLDTLAAAIDDCHPAQVVPMVVWDPAEVEPPAANRWLAVSDSESAARRDLWMRPSVRTGWRSKVAARRAAIDTVCRARDVRPFHVSQRFDATALSRYFLEQVA